MTLEELRFNGCNGHSRIIRMSDREEIRTSLIWVHDLRIVYFPETKHGKGESQEAYLRRMIEEELPTEATYFARSVEIDKHIGVQYYRLAEPGDVLDTRIPVDLPKVVSIGNHRHDDSEIKRLIGLYQPKDAHNYVLKLNNAGKLAAVQFYKLR